MSRSDRSRLHHPRPRPFISEGRKARGQRPEIMPANDPTSTTMLPSSVNLILHAWQAAGHRGAHTNVFKWQGINKMPLLRVTTGNSDILPLFQGCHYNRSGLNSKLPASFFHSSREQTLLCARRAPLSISYCPQGLMAKFTMVGERLTESAKDLQHCPKYQYKARGIYYQNIRHKHTTTGLEGRFPTLVNFVPAVHRTHNGNNGVGV